MCGSEDIFCEAKLNYGPKINFSTTEITLENTPELWCCKNCNSKFTQYIVSQEQAESLYSISDSSERWSNSNFVNGKPVKLISILKEVFSGKSSIVDVGCNSGELLDFAKTLGCDTSGVELSESSLSIIAEKGHKPYRSLMDITNEVDIITAFDLIEHLYDPVSFLRICSDKLKPGGRLVLLTGNPECFSVKLGRGKWWYCQYPEHIVFPSRKFFSELPWYCSAKFFDTYVSKAYETPILRRYSSAMAKIFLRCYNGLPSLGYDHHLVILEKEGK